MRKFIDPKGDYIFFIPNEWGYRNGMYDAKETDPNSFELYENSVGCFQISCSPITKGEIPKLIENNKLKTQEVGKINLDFTERHVPTDKFDMYLWLAVVDDKFIMCKYISDFDKKENKKVIKEIDKARECLKTIMIIEEEHKVEILASERFTKFMNSLGASIDLKNRAYKNGSSIELVVLLANQIDALLRLALILKKQIDNSTDEIDTTLIFQRETDRPIMEKKVYKMALDEGLITQPLHDKLFDLYNQRNKVIHRYIITDLLTKDVMKIVYDYTVMEEKVGEVVKEYEQKQFQLKIGIYGTDTPPDHPIDEETKQKVIGAIKEKHADNRINKDITFE
jgi:hypothetical protein